MDPSSAMVRAGVMAPLSRPMEISGNLKSGSPVGTSPITGTSVSHRTPSSVPATSAASVGGSHFRNFPGQSTPTARVAAAMMRVW